MKYLGVGHSVGAQNEGKSSSPLIFRRRLCQAPRVCAGERDRSSPAAPSRFSFSVRARPRVGPGEGGRFSHSCGGSPVPAACRTALPAAARPLLPAAQPRGSGVGARGSGVRDRRRRGAGFPGRPLPRGEGRAAARGFPGGCSRPACLPAPGRSGNAEQLSDREPAPRPGWSPGSTAATTACCCNGSFVSLPNVPPSSSLGSPGAKLGRTIFGF